MGEKETQASHRGADWFNRDRVASHWDAGDWLRGDTRSVIDDLIEHGLKEAVRVEVRHARTGRVILDPKDVRKTLQRMAEEEIQGALAECDFDDEDAAWVDTLRLALTQ